MRKGRCCGPFPGHLVQRAWQHRELDHPGFTSRYGVKRLVWYEQHGTMEHAIVREKRLKKWNRMWKLRLIEERNPDWQDLWAEILGDPDRSREGANAGH